MSGKWYLAKQKGGSEKEEQSHLNEACRKIREPLKEKEVEVSCRTIISGKKRGARVLRSWLGFFDSPLKDCRQSLSMWDR